MSNDDQKEKWFDAFESWEFNSLQGNFNQSVAANMAWLAACEFQQKEIDALRKTTTVMQNAYNYLCDEINSGEHVDFDWIKQRIEDAAHDHLVKILDSDNKKLRKEIDRLKAQLDEINSYIPKAGEKASGARERIGKLEKQVEIAREGVEYAISGMSHSESKTECRHCALNQTLEKLKEMR